MKVKDRWSSEDFSEMGWHDCRLYSLQFPDENQIIKIAIDYIFKWEKFDNSSFNYWVSPCEITFFNTLNFAVDLNFSNTVCLFVSDLHRFNPRPSPNKKMTTWDFDVQCDNGSISFSATDFEMKVLKQPVLTVEQDLSSF